MVEDHDIPHGRGREVRRLARKVRRVTGPVAMGAGVVAASAWVVEPHQAPSGCGRRASATTSAGDRCPAALAIVGWDFIYYWNHRFMHEVRALWAHHVVHHSSERYNLSTALRQPVADVLGVYLPYGLMARVGIRPALIEQARGVNLLYQYWIHTDAIRSLGAGEEVLNTPSHHRVHHGSNSQYLDRNHGSILIVWDRLFGTFQREDEHGRLRPHQEHRHLQPGAHRQPRVRRHRARRRPLHHLARPPLVRAPRPGLGLPAPRRAGPRRRQLTPTSVRLSPPCGRSLHRRCLGRAGKTRPTLVQR